MAYELSSCRLVTLNGSRYEFYGGGQGFYPLRKWFAIPMIFVPLLYQWECLIRSDVIVFLRLINAVFLRLINAETTAGQNTENKRREHSACLRLSSISILSSKGSGMIWEEGIEKLLRTRSSV